MLRRHIALAIILGVLSTPAVSAQPILGEWNITSPVVIESRTVSAPGGVTIGSGGTLELRNSTLVMNATPPAQPLLKILAGGRLLLSGSPTRPAVIRDTERDLDGEPSANFYYRIVVEPGGQLIGRECRIEGVGADANLRRTATSGTTGAWPFNSGFLVNGTMSLDTCRLQDVNLVQARSANISLNSVQTSRLSAITMETSQVLIQGGRFADSVAVVRSQGFIIDGATFAERATASVSDFRTGELTAGILRNVRMQDYIVCHAGSGNTHVRLELVEFQGCGEALKLDFGANYVVDGFQIRGSTTAGAAGAVHLTGSSLVLQNGSLEANQAELYVDGAGSTAILRNVTWARNVALAGGASLDIQLQGLLEVRVVKGAAPVSNRVVTLSREDGLTLRQTTDPAGIAAFWIPVESSQGPSISWKREPGRWEASASGGPTKGFEASLNSSQLLLTVRDGPSPAIGIVGVLCALAFGLALLHRRV